MTEVVNSEPKLLVQRTISASTEQVFAAFTDGAIMQQWMGPGDVQCLCAECDARVGGAYRIHMRSDEGEHIAVGEYLEVIPNKRLVFTWSWETNDVKNTRITVTLIPEGKGTRVELLHEKLPDQNTADHHTQGWTACLEKLAKHPF